MEIKENIDYINNNLKDNNIRTMTFYDSILNWLRLSVGLGIFQLPYIYKEVGLFTGTIFWILSGIVNYYSYTCLFELSDKLKINDYQKIIKIFLNKYLTKLFNLFLVLDIGLYIMLNPLLAWNQISFIIKLVGFENLVREEEGILIDNNFISRTIFISIALLNLFPFFLKKRIKNFDFFNKTYLLIILTIIITLIIEFPFFINYNIKNNSFYPVNFYEKINKNTIIYFTNFALSFYMQPLVFDLKKEIIDQSLPNLKKITLYSISWQTIIYIFIGGFGYFSLGNYNIPELLNNRKGLLKYDFYMAIFNFIFGILMIIGIPLFNIILRNFCYSLFNKKETSNNFIFFSIVPPLFFIIIGNFFPNIIEIFSVSGSVVCNFNGFIIVFIIYLNMKFKKKFNKNLVVILIWYIFMTFIMFYYILVRIFDN